MKKLMMLLVSFLFACSSPGDAPLTEAETAEIDQAVRALWDQTLSGIEEVPFLLLLFR